VAADQRQLCAKTFITDIAAEEENDWRETCSGFCGDNWTGSPTLRKDLKLSKKSARCLHQLKDKEMKKEQVWTCKAFTVIFTVVSSPS
jgi:hypothetical protein